ncbi:hypothetical protein KIMC2_06200 [Xylocopilactobacillus apis]|uniref:Chloride channel protein n=1 Tax=Xylocopilactobacillus apis TaxID=2932183 RepID=A0AAU9DR12_9LACO|nr:hypothetical protein KIMC2_06200 [Xylocopilactobacillus apis]
MTLGALIGAWSANILINIGVLPINYLPNMVILGMVGFFAGVTKAPFTAILLVSEMVGGTSQVLSLLIVAITSYLVVDELSGKPIYEDLLEQLVRPQNQS